VGSGDRGIDLTQVGIGSQGDLAAMAASLPGVTYIPGADGGPAGFSILGLGADQNLTTLNGLNFAGSDLPRDAVTTGRVSSNPFNPSQGGFSGGQLSLRTSPGTNFVQQTVHITMDSKALQFTDQAGQQLGQQYNNVTFTANGSWRRSEAAGINSVRQIPTNGGQTQNYNTAVQARHSSFFGNGFLAETNTALQLAHTSADPYVSLPDANIRVASTF